MARPYAAARKVWLLKQSEFFDDVLMAAGHMKAVLKSLESTFSPSGDHILDFAGVNQADLERSLRVCEQLMTGLGPTAQALRDELKERQAALCATPSPKN